MTEAGPPLPLFERYPGLAAAAPHVRLGQWPTPITRLTNFERRHDLPAFYVKREDLNHSDCGGSKLRGLEFILGRARQRGVKTLITFGAAGSHHVRTTAWYARRFGIDTVALVVDQPDAAYIGRNLRIGLGAGARFVHVNPVTAAPKLLGHWLGAVGRSGRTMIVPPGGTSPLACLGHVNAALELARQIEAGVCPCPDVIVVPLGSLGTAAGLALGCRLAELPCRLVGVVAYSRWYCTAGRCARMARRALRLMQRWDRSVPDVRLRRSDLTVIPDALGDGYASPTAEAAEVAASLQESEGIELDQTYTAKAMVGGMQYVRRHRHKIRTVLFWQTYQPAGDEVMAKADVEALPPWP